MRKLKEPNLIEAILIGILIIWTGSAFYLLHKASTLAPVNLISWTSLTSFFTGFMSIALIVIAILLEEIRKELSRR